MKTKIMNLQILAALTLALSSNIAFSADAAAGKAKSATCAGCHGAAGISAIPMYPNLAGQKEAYLVKQIKAFKEGIRKDPSMNAMVAALTDADIANLAAYYSGLK